MPTVLALPAASAILRRVTAIDDGPHGTTNRHSIERVEGDRIVPEDGPTQLDDLDRGSGRARARLALAVAVVAAVVLVLVTVGVAATLGTLGGQALVVTDPTGEELLVVPVEEGTEVAIEYTHSVERTPVRDVYVVEGDRLVMDRMEFRSYGAGLPSTAPVTRSDDGDSYVYRPPEREYEMLSVATGHVAGQELVVGSARYDLVEISDAGTVRLTIERRLPFPT